MSLTRNRTHYQQKAARCIGKPAEIVTDSDLIKLSLEGEAFAWDALIERYQAMIYSCALKSGASEHEAGDVFQQVCLILLQSLGTLRDHSKLSSWLISTTKRETWRNLKRNKKHTLDGISVTVEQLASPREENDPYFTTITSTDTELVQIGMSLLGDNCQALLRLLYGARERSYQETADELNIPLGGIGPSRARCLEKLKKILLRLGF